MNIDQRLEAITMSLELLVRDHEDTRKQTVELRESIVEMRQSIRELHSIVQIDAENIRRLANIAQAHEDRISEIEGGAA